MSSCTLIDKVNNSKKYHIETASWDAEIKQADAKFSKENFIFILIWKSPYTFLAKCSVQNTKKNFTDRLFPSNSLLKL